MEVILIRHGKTKGNLEKRYTGKTDENLCQQGIEKLKVMKEKSLYPTVDQVFISPLKRCGETANFLYPEKKPVIIEDFRECDFGVFENKNYYELKNNKQYQDWIDSNGTMPFPKGEGMEEFRKRCVKAFLELMEDIEQNEKKPEVIACIVHGGTIMSIMSQLCTTKKKIRHEDGKVMDYYDYMVENGDGYICTWEDGALQFSKRLMNKNEK